jgi:hypothetical protein
MHQVYVLETTNGAIYIFGDPDAAIRFKQRIIEAWQAHDGHTPMITITSRALLDMSAANALMPLVV